MYAFLIFFATGIWGSLLAVESSSPVDAYNMHICAFHIARDELKHSTTAQPYATTCFSASSMKRLQKGKLPSCWALNM